MSRGLMHALLGQTRRGFSSRCIYCGARSYGRACSAHRDLPQLEAAHINAAAASDGTDSAATASTKGA